MVDDKLVRTMAASCSFILLAVVGVRGVDCVGIGDIVEPGKVGEVIGGPKAAQGCSKGRKLAVPGGIKAGGLIKGKTGNLCVTPTQEK